MQTDRTFDQVWLLESAGHDRPISLLLPREPSFVDYDKRLREAVRVILHAYHLSVPELVEQISSIHADLLFVRVDQEGMRDGTIPLRQAASLLSSVDQMIRAAAISTNNPQSRGRGRAPDFVTEFLNDDIRMGHTKKGSFIVTVAARIDGAEPKRPETPSADGIPSFARQVMTTLARSLDVTRRFAADRGEFADVDEAVNQGLRLPVVQALQEITEAEGMRGLDLSFEWAATEPQRAPVPRRVSMDRVVINELPDIEQRLVRRIEPERVTIVGPVKEMKRSDENPEHGGDVVIHAEVGGRLRRVSVSLSGPDWALAITAFRDHLPFTVTGELGKQRNVWWLNAPIEVDREFLEFRMRQRP
ncbi:hypothetical protein [Nocardia sp. alder85J]|uniref:hypothetical protein n=1 Tax=Nocardia sp. alder85J TaxID=2862949 RepID=UPI0022517704|nr:hypothetical protein [Nocardia sp. alder85J]MCX4093197.1 hypothetical protein [Nocardia sp. alder85J]